MLAPSPVAEPVTIATRPDKSVEMDICVSPLNIPFVIAAANLGTGDRVVHKEAQLAWV